jgi:hypothetical protein
LNSGLSDLTVHLLPVILYGYNIISITQAIHYIANQAARRKIVVVLVIGRLCSGSQLIVIAYAYNLKPLFLKNKK